MIETDHKMRLNRPYMKVALHLVRARREEIARMLEARPYLPVSEVCTRFGVSEATARRDLHSLQQEARITRTHGGALGDYARSFASFAERQRKAASAKARIARAAAALVRPGAVCFLDAGTTLLALARELARRNAGPLSVVTNSLPVAEALSGAACVRVFVVGGEFLNRQATFLGEKACEGLALWKFDTAFLGAEGMSARGLFNSHPEVTKFQQAVLQRSREAYFCVDKTKLGREAPALLAPWGRESRLISDAPPARFAAAGFRPAHFFQA